MLRLEGFRLIRILKGIYSGYTVENGTVLYQPEIKYRIEKKNAFDPTIQIRRYPYHEDIIDCEAILNPNEYEEIYDFLTDYDALYIEFDSSERTLQYPVQVNKLPKLEDDYRSFSGNFKFSLKSLYTVLTPIDFNNIFGYGNVYGNNYGF